VPGTGDEHVHRQGLQGETLLCSPQVQQIVKILALVFSFGGHLCEVKESAALCFSFCFAVD